MSLPPPGYPPGPVPQAPRPQPPGFQPGFPPGFPPPGSAPPFRPAPPRPFAVSLSATLTITASAQALAAVLFVWLMMWAMLQQLSPTNPGEAGLYHLANRGQLGMAQGLAVPLLGFPLLSLVLGFFALIPAPWTRIALTVCGLACAVWLGVWQHHRVANAAVPIGYIGLCVLLLWVPAANAWYRTRGRGSPRG